MKYPDSNSRSAALSEQAKGCLPGGNTRTTVFMKPYPIYAARGQGCRIWDVDGVERIDCGNNFTAAIHGHAHPELIRVASEQLLLGTSFGLPTYSEIELAQLLTSRVSSVRKCRFLNSGTEAVMMALKAARAFTNRPKILKCEGAYHGSYDYAEISLDSSPDNWGLLEAPTPVAYSAGTPRGVLDDVLVIPFNDVDVARALIGAHAHSIAAILVDPMPNRAGLVPATREYLLALREMTARVGALLIFDEVISFRLGYHGAQQIWGVDADLTVFGKIIGGGFPIGAIGGSDEIMAVFDPTGGKPPVPQGGTFCANPMSMRCGATALAMLDRESFTHLAALGERVRDGIDEVFRRRGVPGQTTGMGSLLRVHMSNRELHDYRSATPSPEESKRLSALTTALLNEGLLLPGYGLMALSTPMNSSDADAIVAAFDRVIGRGWVA